MPLTMERINFDWTETADELRRWLARGELLSDRKGRHFTGGDDREQWRFTPPLVQGIPAETREAGDYLARLPESLGTQAVILLQAGAAAIGLWREDECLQHKVIKKYVVRGKGRAQPTHLKTAGKSRYGSRLRLRNARALLVELNERLCSWRDEEGPFDAVFYSCPVRTWPELWRLEPQPPFSRSQAIKIPKDVAIPGLNELMRVRRFLSRGCVTIRPLGEDGGPSD